MPSLREWLVAARLGDYAPAVREYAGDLEDVAELTASDGEDIAKQIQGKVKKRKFADAFAAVVAHAKRGAPMSSLVLEVTNLPSFPVRARLFARLFARLLARLFARLFALENSFEPKQGRFWGAGACARVRVRARARA